MVIVELNVLAQLKEECPEIGQQWLALHLSLKNYSLGECIQEFQALFCSFVIYQRRELHDSRRWIEKCLLAECCFRMDFTSVH